MPEPLDVWVGKDEVDGVPSQPRKDVRPPPHWRLEAVAATERPRSLTVAPDGRTAAFIQDRDTSDVWLLELGGGAPSRLTTGRDPAPYWEDTESRISPDGTRVAYADQGSVWVVAAAGGPPRQLAEAGSPVWLRDDRLVVSVERDDTSRLAVLDVADPWPRPLCGSEPQAAPQAARAPAAPGEHGLERYGDEWGAAVSPDGTAVAFAFTPRHDLLRAEIRVADVASGAVRALTGTSALADRSPAWSPDGATIAFSSERSGWYELYLIGADGTGGRQLTHVGADFTGPEWHHGGGRLVATRCRRNRFDLVTVDAATGEVTVVAEGGSWSSPHWTADGAIVATYEDVATPPQIRLVREGESPETLHAPTPLAVRAAPHVRPEDVTYTSFDGLEIPAFLFRPSGASREHPVPAIVYPHGGPTSCYGDDWDGHAQYFLDKGYAWLAVNFRGSTGYGREYERRNHGDWGVGDTKDCLAAADYLRTLDWVDGNRLGIFGSSYGSYLALLAVTDDPEHRFRCAVAKYGDCDILSSWAQGDREGVQDLGRMMDHPSRDPGAYRAGSPVHRLANVEVPLLIAHGELDLRVSPKQSEELVQELRRLGGKTFEYVTYPTEAHGFLRAGPQLHFYRRLERFLDWYLM
jgi:dipeptidyl aminopeptidase/acylaminoacyl peptidase